MIVIFCVAKISSLMPDSPLQTRFREDLEAIQKALPHDHYSVKDARTALSYYKPPAAVGAGFIVQPGLRGAKQ